MFEYSNDTPNEVKTILEKHCHKNTRLRLYYGDQKTGADWREEHDTLGTIGRSTGQKHIPLLIATSRSFGGQAILTNCIVKITLNKRVLYQHENYHLGTITSKESTDEGYCEAVFVDGNLCAQFSKPGQAARYIAFLKGERDSK
jgi:hypothetical protein